MDYASSRQTALTRKSMASPNGHEVPLGLPHREQQETAGVATALSSDGEKVAGDYRSSEPTPSSSSASDLLPEASGSAEVKTARTRYDDPMKFYGPACSEKAWSKR